MDHLPNPMAETFDATERVQTIINSKELPFGVTWKMAYHKWSSIDGVKCEVNINGTPTRYIWNDFELVSNSYIAELESDKPNYELLDLLKEIANPRHESFISSYERSGVRELVWRTKQVLSYFG